MTLIQFNGHQYTITIPKEDIEQLGWKKGTEVYISKDPEEDRLFIVEKRKNEPS